MRFLKTAAVAATFVLALTASASAAVITLDFDDLNSTVNESPLNYYAGGFGSAGTGPGPNYGITFSANTLTGCVVGNPCANVNSALAPSQPNVIFFLSGSANTMNVVGGFDTGFSFFYSAVNVPGFINVWSGFDGTGVLLATLNLPVTPLSGDPGCLGAGFCPYVPVGVSFAGLAHSVDFGGTADQIGFDNITLGSATPGGVPEPLTLALFGAGLAGVAGMRRRRRA